MRVLRHEGRHPRVVEQGEVEAQRARADVFLVQSVAELAAGDPDFRKSVHYDRYLTDQHEQQLLEDQVNSRERAHPEELSRHELYVTELVGFYVASA